MSVLSQQYETDENLRNIFKKHFGIDEDKNRNNPGYLAYAGYATECAVSLANIILATKRPESGRTLRAVQDLVYGLNANDFWVKNAPVLIPIFTVILNSYSDGLNLNQDSITYKEYSGYDSLISAAKSSPLELFSMMLYLVGGPLLMSVASTKLKLDLVPYFVAK